MTLLKGPVGLALIAAASLLSWWWGGPAVAWRRVGWRRGMMIFAGVTVPWYLAIGILSRGEFFRFAVGTQIAQRIATGLEQHGGFPGYYAVLSLPMFYPWSALVPASLVMAWTQRKVDPASGFLLGWIIGPMLVLECVSTKLIHYYLPAYPACALLVAWWVVEAARLGMALTRWPLGRLGIKLIGAIAIGGVAGLLGGAIFLPAPLRAPCLVMAVVLAVGSAAGRVWLARGMTYQGASALVVTWAGVMGLLVAWALPSGEPYRLSRAVGEHLATTSARIGVRPAVMTYQEPGVIYALGRPATDVRGPDELVGEVRRNGPVLLPLMPEEVDLFQADPRFRCEQVGAVLGFNANKGKQQVLHLAVIGAGDSIGSLARSSTGRATVRKVTGAGGPSSRSGTGRRTAPDPPGPSARGGPDRPPAGGSPSSAHRGLAGEQDPRLGSDNLLRPVDVVADRRPAHE